MKCILFSAFVNISEIFAIQTHRNVWWLTCENKLKPVKCIPIFPCRTMLLKDFYAPPPPPPGSNETLWYGLIKSFAVSHNFRYIGKDLQGCTLAHAWAHVFNR